MQALCEVVGHDRECVRRKMRGRLQCGADIPAMDGAFKDHPAHQRAHGNNAPTMMTEGVPLVWAETGDKVIEWSPV